MTNNNEISLNDLNLNNVSESEMADMYKLDMDIKAIPNLKGLLDNIYDLVKDIERPEMEELENRDRKEFERLLTHKYYSKINSIKIINLILDSNRYDNLIMLLEMFELLENIKNKKTGMEDGHKQWCEKVNEKYIYSKHGGKTAFEEMLKKKD